jgi:hypothetical protein
MLADRSLSSNHRFAASRFSFATEDFYSVEKLLVWSLFLPVFLPVLVSQLVLVVPSLMCSEANCAGDLRLLRPHSVFL